MGILLRSPESSMAGNPLVQPFFIELSTIDKTKYTLSKDRFARPLAPLVFYMFNRRKPHPRLQFIHLYMEVNITVNSVYITDPFLMCS